MVNKVLNTIKKWNMIETGDHVFIGLSGGADSVCLLYVLNQLKDQLGIHLHAIHVHHGLREADADLDADFTRKLCDQMNIPYNIVNRDIRTEAKSKKLSEEEAGRNARYEVFIEISSQYNPSKIAVAHHMNDQAETVLLNLMRGSGLRGLGGIKPVREGIIRPLIECDRNEIEHFLNEVRQSYRVDHTNDLNLYTRNKIRNELIPYMEQNFNKALVLQLCKMSEIMREDESYLECEANKYFNELKKQVNQKEVILDVEQLTFLNPAIRKRIYKLAVKMLKTNLKDYGYKHLCSIDELLTQQTGKRIDLPYGILVEKVYQSLRFYKDNKEKIEWEYLVEKSSIYLNIQEVEGAFTFNYLENKNNGQFPENRYTKWFDYDRIEGNLKIRNRRNGDYIRLKDSGRKKLKDYFIDLKIPREERNRIPLITDDTDVIWIVGYRINEQYKVTQETKRILEISFKGGLLDE